MTPYIGAVVQYVTFNRATEAAVIVGLETISPEGEVRVNLRVLPNSGELTRFQPSVALDPDGGQNTWHWIIT